MRRGNWFGTIWLVTVVVVFRFGLNCTWTSTFAGLMSFCVDFACNFGNSFVQLSMLQLQFDWFLPSLILLFFSLHSRHSWRFPTLPFSDNRRRCFSSHVLKSKPGNDIHADNDSVRRFGSIRCHDPPGGPFPNTTWSICWTKKRKNAKF